MRPVALHPLKHRCTACGGSCHGVKVRLVDASAADRIRQIGEEMEIEQPVIDNTLRQTDEGQCVFQDANGLCGIHGTYGAEAKPLICRQYPLVLVHTEGEDRVGIDPGCYSAFSTRDSDETVSLTGDLAWLRVEYPPPVAQMEAALLHLLGQPQQTAGGAMARLAGPGADLAGYSVRWVSRLSDPKIAEAARHPSAGPSVRSAFKQVLANIPSWSDGGIPEVTLAPELEEWGLEVVRRLVALRLCPAHPSPMLTALLALGGVDVARWVSGGEPVVFVKTLAAWSRAMRSPMFWGTLFPDIQTVQWVLRGER